MFGYRFTFTAHFEWYNGNGSYENDVMFTKDIYFDSEPTEMELIEATSRVRREFDQLRYRKVKVTYEPITV